MEIKFVGQRKWSKFWCQIDAGCEEQLQENEKEKNDDRRNEDRQKRIWRDKINFYSFQGCFINAKAPFI